MARRRRRRPAGPDRRLTAALVLVGLAAVAVPVITAANTVAPSRASTSDHAVTANQLKPPQCDGINLTAVVVNGNGGTASELIVGTAGNDALQGGRGNDCMVMGDGNDTALGQQGTDVCLGQAGTDTLVCETTDGP